MEFPEMKKICPKDYDDTVAVVGMSCKFPGADNVEEFWELLAKGEDAITKVPSWRWVGDEDFSHDPEVREQKAGFLKCPVDEFDAKFFGISPREVQIMDPQQRILLEVTWEALENAGINALELNGTKTSVYCGAWKQDYEKLLTKYSANQILGWNEEFLGNSFSALSARLAFHLGVTGPNITTEAGCAASLVSLHLACQSLRSEDTDLAIVGGVNLLLHPFTRKSLNAEQVLAPDGRCKTFDSAADGYGRAEGCAAVILKRYQDAVKNGDRILAIIRGSAMSQEGTSKSFGTPTMECQSACMKEGLKKANVQPCMVSYVEAHGTGTVIGDPVEAEAIKKAYSPGRTEALWIGSVKANIGHTESCAGLAGLIKIILSLQKKLIPPQINFKTLNPKINLEAIPARVPTSLVEWNHSSETPRTAGLNSFGMTGTNVHVIVQEASVVSKDEEAIENEMYKILTVSAKSEWALKELIQRYKTFLKKETAISLGNFCYTAKSRAHWNRRIAVIGQNSSNMIDCLENGTFIQNTDFDIKGKIVFLFTGQGSQFSGMGKFLYENHRLFRYHFCKCSKIIKLHMGQSLEEIFWSENHLQNVADKSVYDQVLIFSIEYCLWKLWENVGMFPDFILGHSMGEFAAAVAAGVLRMDDALTLLIERAKLVNTLPEGRMLVVKENEDVVKKIIHSFLEVHNSIWVDIAAINSENQIVVSGSKETVYKFAQFCKNFAIKTTFLSSERAYHSRDMDGILDRFRKVASKISYSTPKFSYFSSHSGKSVTDNEINSEYWQRNVRMPVRFKDAFNSICELNGRIFVEIGPQPVLLAIGNTIASKMISDNCLWIPSMRKSCNEWKTFLEGVAKLYVNGLSIDWNAFYSHFHNEKISIPSYPFEHSKKYWVEKRNVRTSNAPLGHMLHPLIGSVVHLANLESTVFQQNLKLQNLRYIGDHVIFNKVILPAAGFLEMILASGHLAVQRSVDRISKPPTLIVIRDFKIEKALELKEEEVCLVQVIVKPHSDDVSNNLAISISKQVILESGHVSWITHAAGQFHYGELESTEPNLNIINIKENSLLKEDNNSMYSSLSKIGFNFGESFKSVKRIWENDDEVLAEIDTPENSQNYLLHPILLDSMVQTVTILSIKHKQFCLPIGFKKFVLYPFNSTRSCFSYLRKSNPSVVKLVDGFGNLMAMVEGIHLLESTASQFFTALNSQKREMVALHEIVWRKAEQPPTFRESVMQLGSVEQNATPHWIIFTDNYSSDILTESFGNIGKSIVLVRKGTSFSKSNNEFVIDPNCNSQVSEFFELVSGNDTLEGVIYMWDIEVSSVDHKICKPLLSVLQNLIASNVRRIILVTKGAVSIANENVKNLEAATAIALIKSLKAEHSYFDCKCIDLDPSNFNLSLDISEVINVLYRNGEMQYAIRNSEIYVPRFSKVAFNKTIEISISPRFKINIPSTNSINDLTIGIPEHSDLMQPNEITISVCAAALNFRDIMVIMKPEGYHTLYPSCIGTDFSGVITAIGSSVKTFQKGDFVFGVDWKGALASHAIVPEYSVLKKPTQLTHLEAACLPTVFSTAYYSLVNVAQLSNKDTILIHSASGGVGLVAIQIAQKIGAKIITTAGSDAKRSYLKSLGIEYIFNSRTTVYADEIDKITEGRGVDVVLNSLTGPNYKESTLRICNRNARFIEMSKVNIWRPEDVAELRPDVHYTVVDFEKFGSEDHKYIFARLGNFINEKNYTPIPYIRFELAQIKAALRYLQNAKHIGKVVIAIPEFKTENGRSELVTKQFNSESTYVITGGLGGVGLEVAKWMIRSGAKYIILIARSPADEKMLKNMNSNGSNVMAMQGDISNYKDMEYIFNTVENKLPPIRGIIHAAGVSADGMIENQRWENFEETFKAKLKGTWNLHKLTMKFNLEHFVLFSSNTVTISSIGQSAYIASNAFLDAFVYYRRSLGLKAQSINWGAWSEVGMASKANFTTDGTLGVLPFSSKRGLSAFEAILRSHHPQITVADIIPSVILHYFPHLQSYLSELITSEQKKPIIMKKVARYNILEGISGKSENEQLHSIQKYILSKIGEILRLNISDITDHTELFTEMGMDSLMAVEFQNELQQTLGKTVPINSSTLLDYPSVDTISKYILQCVMSNELPKAKDETEEDYDLRKQIKEDSMLCANLIVDPVLETPKTYKSK